MSTTTVRSEQLKVFPISSSRQGFLYIRNSDYESNLSSLPEADQNFVTTYHTISSDEFNEKTAIQSFYTKTSMEVSVYNGRALTEKNLSSIIRKLADRDCYVVDKALEYRSNTYSENAFIEFILAGRYFRLSLTGMSVGPLWVGIKLEDKDEGFERLPAIDTSDDTDWYINNDSIVFSTDQPSGYDYKLQLLEDDGTTVPINSMFRFERNVIKNICGGTV